MGKYLNKAKKTISLVSGETTSSYKYTSPVTTPNIQRTSHQEQPMSNTSVAKPSFQVKSIQPLTAQNVPDLTLNPLKTAWSGDEEFDYNYKKNYEKNHPALSRMTNYLEDINKKFSYTQLGHFVNRVSNTGAYVATGTKPAQETSTGVS